MWNLKWLSLDVYMYNSALWGNFWPFCDFLYYARGNGLWSVSLCVSLLVLSCIFCSCRNDNWCLLCLGQQCLKMFFFNQVQIFKNAFCLVYCIKSIWNGKKFIVYHLLHFCIGDDVYVLMVYRRTMKEIQCRSPIYLWFTVRLLCLSCVLSAAKFDWSWTVQAVNGIHCPQRYAYSGYVLVQVFDTWFEWPLFFVR